MPGEQVPANADHDQERNRAELAREEAARAQAARAQAAANEENTGQEPARTLWSRMPSMPSMPSVIPSSKRFTYDSVMKKKDCILDIESIRNKLDAAAKQAIPEAFAEAIPKNPELLRAIARSEEAKNVLGIPTSRSGELIDLADRMQRERNAAPATAAAAAPSAGGRKRRKSRKMKKSRKPKRGKKSNKRKRTRRH